MFLVEHLEQHLGPMIQAHQPPADFPDISIVEFRDQPFPGVTTYITHGMSDYNLSRHGQQTRTELLIPATEDTPPEVLYSYLLLLAHNYAQPGLAPLRGEIVDLGEALGTAYGPRKAYMCVPAFYPRSFATVPQTGLDIALIWALPIYPRESEWIKQEGWEQFEAALAKRSTRDYWDLQRPIFEFVSPA